MKLLPEYTTYAIPVTSIYYDPLFNCRDPFTVESVQDLADSIASSGLKYPIIVQPWGDGYRLVAGHRRFIAATAHLKWIEIPAMIRELDEIEARRLNFLENLQRKDLNLSEEAKAVARLYPGKTPSVRQVTKDLKLPHRHAYLLLQVLRLPEEIQDMVAAGTLAKSDIETVSRLAGDKQLKAARELSIARKKHRRRRPRNSKLPFNKLCPKVRTKAEINKMVTVLFEKGVTGLPTRVAVWCAGRITDEELETDIKDYQCKSPLTPSSTSVDSSRTP